MLNVVAPTWKMMAEVWATCAALGSILYLFGYLSLRFHLTAFGIETELGAVDERYLFAGARFLVYLVTLVPIVVLLILLATAVSWFLSRAFPRAARERIHAFFAEHWQETWAQRPGRLSLMGIVLSVVLIQLVMRKCFLFSNLLVKETLSGPEWLKAILLAKHDGLQALFFAGLVAGVAASSGLLFLAMAGEAQTAWSRLLEGLLAFLIVVQFLLLPVNHGMLIAEKTVPKVSSLTGSGPLEDDREAWRVWDGKEWVTFLVQEKKPTGNKRTLVSLPRKEVKRIEITQFDRILAILFRP